MNRIFFLLALIISVGAVAAPVTDASLDNFFKEKTKIDNPMELRDPFKAPPTKASRRTEEKNTSRKYTRSDKDEFRNTQDAALNEIDIYNIKLVGVLIGKERRAMILAKPGDKQTIIVKEGSKLGPDNAEVKAILPGGMILIEKIINVYGQEEYLETVIPISR